MEPQDGGGPPQSMDGMDGEFSRTATANAVAAAKVGWKGGTAWLRNWGPPVAFAVILPLLLNLFGGEQHPGSALLPAVYMASWKLRVQMYTHFYLMPLLCLLVYVLEVFFGSVSPETSDDWAANVGWQMLPMVAILSHYLLVVIASDVSKVKREAIDDWCQSVSAFLDRKCYQEMTWHPFLYAKAERVLLSIASVFKIIVAILQICMAAAILGAPQDLVKCQPEGQESQGGWKAYAWTMYGVLCFQDVVYHSAMYLSGNFGGRKAAIRKSFAEPALQPTYWEWYFIASYYPTQSIWLPITIECLRSIPVALARMRDKQEVYISNFLWIIDVAAGLFMLISDLTGHCNFPHNVIYRQLSLGFVWAVGIAEARWRKHKILSRADKPVEGRLYFPVGHHEIDCMHRKWLAGRQLPEQSGPIDLGGCPCGKCKGYYFAEGELELEREETKLDFNDPTLQTWVSYKRKTTLPGAWVRIDVHKKAGIKLARKPMGTALEGQFRVIYPLVDHGGCLKKWGDFNGRLFAAKRYKKDPEGGWDLEELDNLESEAEIRTMANRHNRMLKPYFQDCLMSEKAAEFGRAFNEIENLSVRKVDIMRACIMELDHDKTMPVLYLVERFLEDDAPFQKFNNNDYVPGNYSRINTPNMLSLFSYFKSDRTLLMCDVQGKKTKFTDMQFHSSDLLNDFDDLEDDHEEDVPEMRDWMHSDGGFVMMKRVLVGLYKQDALQALARKVWPEQTALLEEEVESWLEEPEFSKEIKALEKAAKIYSVYFQALNPVMQTGSIKGAAFIDRDQELVNAMKSGSWGATMDMDESSGTSKGGGRRRGRRPSTMVGKAIAWLTGSGGNGKGAKVTPVDDGRVLYDSSRSGNGTPPPGMHQLQSVSVVGARGQRAPARPRITSADSDDDPDH
eukprot:CAMPEP_0114134680 /NCGR_PEP_ID=MMETSP0043_2-20121206/14305_1 /TAXON_ID=464988 /ORGANISM="Hemiselmis andersenii, Strain CCMP644" /LENGTH=903 /DNA_ID=CAMNT_0001228373 /DNA_START=1 /DNA_END=2709 /DNA_ORIENTATION=+